MARGVWLVKSEPSVYAWDRLVEDGRTAWEGVRNYEARNNLRAMKKGDLLLYYHSNEGKEIVGLAKVAKTAYPDPTRLIGPRGLRRRLRPVGLMRSSIERLPAPHLD